MEFQKFVLDFARASNVDRLELLLNNPSYGSVKLAEGLKDLCVSSWEGDMELVFLASESVDYLALTDSTREISAFADWCGGYAALANGEMEIAIERLDRAAAVFEVLKQPHTAASAQILKLYPLASLNRFDDAIGLGSQIRSTLLLDGDLTAVGKIELNLGNLYYLRDRYSEAETLFRSARLHFATAPEIKLLLQAENSLAVALTMQNRFREAEEIYRLALPRAEEAQLNGIKAAIESSLGVLALSQGRYDRALDFLERARQGYSILKMPYPLATTEREIADAYLELNLASEASSIYERLAADFAGFGTPFEQAHARINYARALLLTGKNDDARKQLREATGLYHECSSDSGRAAVTLMEAQADLMDKNYEAAVEAASRAHNDFSRIGMTGKALLARLLEIESHFYAKNLDAALELSNSALAAAEEKGLPQIAWRLHTLQGSIFVAENLTESAEKSFERAVSIIEKLRAPLPAEEFRTSFFADKLEPYWELARLCLQDKTPERNTEALNLIERSRARTLVELMGTRSPELFTETKSDSNKGLSAELESLREELNWFYSRLNRPLDGANPNHESILSLEAEVYQREKAISELMRQNASRLERSDYDGLAQFDIEELRRNLASDTVFVEYAVFDEHIAAFVIDREKLDVVQLPTTESEVAEKLKKFQFQIEALRYGSDLVRRHLFELTLRTRFYLEELYNVLLRPLEKFIGRRRLVIAPHRILHYVPFAALYDGVSYVLESRQIVLTPSAASWQASLRKEPVEIDHALLVAAPDKNIPRVIDEIREIERTFGNSTKLIEDEATLSALRRYSASANVLHIACHGHFRADNPLFSALKLADGRLTVYDAANLDLKNCELAVLSACETGLNLVAPGDELLGLMRGFMKAGVPSLILSRWAVDDEAAVHLMSRFYRYFKTGRKPAAALRTAQLETLKIFPHPFFWASFILIGRP